MTPAPGDSTRPERDASALETESLAGSVRARRALPADRARTLLRKLRDLDLHTGRVELHGGLSVRVDGCLSADVPIEGAVRYRLRADGGAEHVLEIAWRQGELELELTGAGETRRRRVALFLDEAGRAAAPALGARMDPDSADRREVEHFLRRLVRGAF